MVLVWFFYLDCCCYCVVGCFVGFVDWYWLDDFGDG